MPLCGAEPDDLNELWLCQNEPGGLDPELDRQFGCEAGCHPCSQDSGTPTRSWAASQDGSRWVRPDPLLESRNAVGEFEVIENLVPQRVMSAANYQLAQCFNPGTAAEHFDLTICECQSQCRTDDAGIPSYIFPTCGVYRGSGWPPLIDCLGRYTGYEPISVSFAGSYLGNLGTVRTTSEAQASHNPTGCTTNAMSLCAGHAESSGCNTSSSYYDGYLADVAEPGLRSLWDWITVPEIAASWHAPTEAENPHADTAEIKLRNDVMEWLERRRASHNLLHQAQSVRRSATDADNHNVSLEEYGALWPPNDEPIPFDLCPAMTTDGAQPLLTGKLRLLETEVVVEYVLQQARLDVAVQMIRERYYEGGSVQQWRYPTRPAIKIRLELELGMRCRFPDDTTAIYTRPWLEDEDPHKETELAILNHARSGVPKVVPDYDGIVFRNSDGDIVTNPPTSMLWEGHMGPFSDPPWELIDNANDIQNGPLEVCCLISRHMQAGLEVMARESHPDSKPGDRGRWLYDGSITIASNGNFEQLCSYLL